MSGPYRTPLGAPERYESFWLDLERRRKKLRKLRWSLAVTVLLPSLAVSSAAAIGKTSADEPRRVMGKALGEPWGLVISRVGVEPFVGTRPAGAVVPDANATPIPAPELQRLFSERSEAIRACYVEMSRYVPDLTGDLIVSVAILDGRQVNVTTGKESLRRFLGPCVRRELERAKLPAHDEVAWVHFPIRFER